MTPTQRVLQCLEYLRAYDTENRKTTAQRTEQVQAMLDRLIPKNKHDRYASFFENICAFVNLEIEDEDDPRNYHAVAAIVLAAAESLRDEASWPDPEMNCNCLSCCCLHSFPVLDFVATLTGPHHPAGMICRYLLDGDINKFLTHINAD